MTDEDYLRTGAAVMTCVVSAVLAVMATVPAVRFLQAVRECCIAVLVAAVGALATVGFHPVISLVRFEYATLGLALVGGVRGRLPARRRPARARPARGAGGAGRRRCCSR